MTAVREAIVLPIVFLTATLLAGVTGTRELFYGASVGEIGDYLQLIGVFDALFVAGGLGMFELLIEG